MQLVESLPNVFPESIGASRLAVVTECPSKDDALTGESFNSSSGRFIKALLSQVGVVPQQCFLGYVYDRPAPWGKLSMLKDKSLLEPSLNRLIEDLKVFNPNCILLLGDTTLKLFGGTHSLDNFRGSLFVSPFYGWKCVASYTPLHCFQQYMDTSLLKFDMHRAGQESFTPELSLPERRLDIAADIGTAFNFLNQVAVDKRMLGFDVEGYPDAVGVTCFSFAPSPDYSCVIPLRRMNNQNIFSVPDEVLIWQKLCEILENPDIAIICQNAMYELFMMAYRHRIVVSNIRDDTMIKHWELYPELPKNLGLQTSLYTREPYFKDGRKASTDIGHWEYNAKDSAILLDINETQDALLSRNDAATASYKFKMQLLKPYTYMSVKGCRIDLGRLTEHRKRLFADIVRLQNKLNELVGKPLNAKSSKDKQWLLYDYMQFKKVYKTDPKTKAKRVTADEETILKCKQACSNPLFEDILQVLLDLIKARTDFSDTFKLEPFEDGRIRCSHNPVGTETGRLSTSATAVRDRVTKPKIELGKTGQIGMKAVTKVDFRGTNLQNVSKWLRDVFVPDPGYVFWQYDFSGADAWTVAADLYALGHDAMLEHLMAGVKPSCVILMMQKYGTEVIQWSTNKILEVQPEMKNAGKMYVCAKACQHGSNYGMGPQLLADTIFKRSNGEINITASVAKSLQQAYENYYRVSIRTNYVKQQLTRNGYLDTASGSRRKFLGIRNSNSIDATILRAALSHEPQNNTTYATNRALYTLYYSDRNRAPDNSLIVQPLLMIHDALAGQIKKESTSEMREFLENAFTVEMTIHGVDITIPAEGGFGANWKTID